MPKNAHRHSRVLRLLLLHHLPPLFFFSLFSTPPFKVALHYVFEAPEDKIVWDVAHQAYPHKILTGRRDRMPTLRQKDGLSGFTKMKESK